MVETASQSSPWTNTFPAGDKAVSATPTSPINPCASGYDFVAASAHGDAHEEGSNDPERNAHRESGGKVNAHLGDWAIHEQEPSEHQQRDATDGEDAMAGKFCFESEEGEGSDNQTTAAKRTGKRFSAKAANKMKTTPTVPGITAPGWLNSAKRARAPIANRMKVMFGSMM